MSREVDRSVTRSFNDLHPASPWWYHALDTLKLVVDSRTDDERLRYEDDVIRANRAEHATMSQGVETVDADRV
jgi:hypothetical protein